MNDLEGALRDRLATVELAAAVPPDLLVRLRRHHRRRRLLEVGVGMATVVVLIVGSGVALAQHTGRSRPVAQPSATPHTGVAAAPDPGAAAASTATEFVTTTAGTHSVMLRFLDSDGITQRTLELPGAQSFVTVSPDRRWVAYETSRGLELTAVDHVAPRLLVRAGSAAPFAWSPDSRQIIYRSTDQSVSIIQIGDASHRLLASHLGFAYDAAWSPDGTRIAVSTLASTGPDGNEQMHPDKPGTIVLFAPSGKRLRTVPTSCAAPAHPDWSPNGASIAWYCGWLERNGTDPWPAHPVQTLNLTTGKTTNIGTAESRQPSWLTNTTLIVVPVPLPANVTPGTVPPAEHPTRATEYDSAGHLLRTVRIPTFDQLQVLRQPRPD